MKRWIDLGGPGSGHWGHAGRKGSGEPGGSLPRSVAMSIKGAGWEVRYVEKALGVGTTVTIHKYPEVSEAIAKVLPNTSSALVIKSLCVKGEDNVINAYPAYGTGGATILVNNFAYDAGRVELGLRPSRGDFHLAYITLPKSIQGGGNAREKVAAWAAMAKANGYSQLSLLADISVGRYAWAKLGFDFKDELIRKNFQSNLSDIAKPYGLKVPIFKTAKEMASWNPGIQIKPSAIRPVSGEVKDNPTSFGKAFMLASGPWDGVLKL